MVKIIKDLFDDMAGKWTGTNKIWFKPNGEINFENDTEEVIEFIFGGKFLLHTTRMRINEELHEGSRIISYIDKDEMFKSTWIDTFHNGVDIMIQEGTDIDKLSLLGNYKAGDQLWGWRTEYHLKNMNELIISHYNITPEGEEYLGVESSLNRLNSVE